MALTVTVVNEAFPEDHEFDVVGLGLFVNGEATEIDEDRERNFVSATHSMVNDAFKDSETIKVEGTSTLKGGVEGVLGVKLEDISDTFTEGESPEQTAAREATEAEQAALETEQDNNNDDTPPPGGDATTNK